MGGGRSGRVTLFILYIFIFRDRGREGEGEDERNIDERQTSLGYLSCAPNQGPDSHNPGMCPDWELNWWPCGLQGDAQPTEHRSQGGNSDFQ